MASAAANASKTSLFVAANSRRVTVCFATVAPAAMTTMLPVTEVRSNPLARGQCRSRREVGQLRGVVEEGPAKPRQGDRHRRTLVDEQGRAHRRTPEPLERTPLVEHLANLSEEEACCEVRADHPLASELDDEARSSSPTSYPFPPSPRNAWTSRANSSRSGGTLQSPRTS